MEVPAGSPPIHLDPGEPAIRALVSVSWEGSAEPWDIDCIVDTGCPVDFVASRRLSAELRKSARPSRVAQLEWGGRVTCEIYRATADLGEWIDLEVYAPLDADFEDLLGLTTIMRSNLCIRGLAGSAYWVQLPAAGGGREFVARDAERRVESRTRDGKRKPLGRGRR